MEALAAEAACNARIGPAPAGAALTPTPVRHGREPGWSARRLHSMALHVTLPNATLPRTTARVLPALSWHGALAIAAAVLDVAALCLTLASAHASACAGGVSRPVVAPASTCTGPLALPPFTTAAAVGLVGIFALGLLPAVTLCGRRRWPCTLAAVGQVALQIAGGGLFLLWWPALILAAVAAVV